MELHAIQSLDEPVDEATQGSNGDCRSPDTVLEDEDPGQHILPGRLGVGWVKG